MIYKTFQKVSNVCQLLDKRKFNPSQTINGVTFTNNGDGTITVNGTATSTAFFLLFKYLDSLIPKHKYLLSGSPNDASVNAYIQCYDDTNFEWLRDTGGGAIAIFPKQVVNLSGANNIRLRIASGYTANNLVFKPQLFDLTEMYGAGNEPTTVEQFRQDFPEEMYDYSPRCFIKSYKTLLKASDVCQFIKPNLFYNPTSSGITITNNGDTFTVNGTATKSSSIGTEIKNWTPIIGHKILVSGCPEGGGANTFSLGAFNQRGAIDYGNGAIGSVITTGKWFGIIFNSGVTFDNLIFKPQLFDLTEMYGAGNEPTTVAQFRQDFPEEMYDYKPYSTIPSYKKSLVCKTKNLLDNIPVKTNYIINSNGEEVATPGYNIYGKMYGNNFTISTNAPVDLNGSDNWLRVCLYNSEGIFITRKDFDFNKRTVANIADDNIAYIQLCFHRNSFPNYKLQVEYGTTPTEYHPYGYL